MLKKKCGPILKFFLELLPQIIVTKLSEIWVWDPGSGTKLFQIRIQRSKRHRIPDPDQQLNFWVTIIFFELVQIFFFTCKNKYL